MIKEAPSKGASSHNRGKQNERKNVGIFNAFR